MSYKFLQQKAINYIIKYLNDNQNIMIINEIKKINTSKLNINITNKQNENLDILLNSHFLEYMNKAFNCDFDQKYEFEYIMTQILEPIMDIYGFTIMKLENENFIYDVIMNYHEINKNKQTCIYININANSPYLFHNYKMSIRGLQKYSNIFGVMCCSFNFLCDPLKELESCINQYFIDNRKYIRINLFHNNINNKIFNILNKYWCLKYISYDIIKDVFNVILNKYLMIC